MFLRVIAFTEIASHKTASAMFAVCYGAAIRAVVAKIVKLGTLLVSAPSFVATNFIESPAALSQARIHLPRHMR